VSGELSGEEVRAQNIAAMGEPLGDLFTLLSTDLTWLFVRWKQYVQLFATKESRLDLMNRAAPFFFGVIQRVLWEETLLGIARLTGPQSTAGKQNLSLRRLPSLIGDDGLRAKIEERLEVVKDKTSFALDWRHRHIAHRDLSLLQDKKAEPLAVASKQAVDDALDSMADVLNAIDKHFSNSSTAYWMTLTTWGAEELLFTIRDGLRLQELREEREENGHYDLREWNEDQAPV
jgi:hypothetical protein